MRMSKESRQKAETSGRPHRIYEMRPTQLFLSQLENPGRVRRGRMPVQEGAILL